MPMKYIALAFMVCSFASAQRLDLCAGVSTFGDQNYIFERTNGQLLGSVQFQHPPVLASTTDSVALSELKTILDAVNVKLSWLRCHGRVVPDRHLRLRQGMSPQPNAAVSTITWTL